MKASNQLISLEPDWFEHLVGFGVDENLSGIYEWTIGGVGSYIGKYSSRNRPVGEYCNNVRKHLNGLPYRKNKADRFRRIHCELARAYREKLPVCLKLLANNRQQDLNSLEAALIVERRPVLNGRPSGCWVSEAMQCHGHPLMPIRP
jgi:hypothetical protein